MISLDTNILLYGTNRDCPEFQWANPVLTKMVSRPDDWLLADQVLFEYYRLVRSPKVLARPLDAAAAARQVEFFRDESGCQHCNQPAECWGEALRWMRRGDFPAARTFDLVLAVTLRLNGVRLFYTRNERDFRDFGFFDVVNPEFEPL